MRPAVIEGIAYALIFTGALIVMALVIRHWLLDATAPPPLHFGPQVRIRSMSGETGPLGELDVPGQYAANHGHRQLARGDDSR
jgi:hypothetical protein